MTAGVTQEELADQSGLSVRGLRYLEQGLHLPYQDTVRRLVAGLKLLPEDAAALAAAARSGKGQGNTAGADSTVLPVPLTPLVGQEELVRKAVDLLSQEDVRLVTLTGPGGVGKTRVGLQVAAEWARESTGDVIWVPLESLTDHELVLPAVAQALGLKGAGPAPLAETVAARVRARPVLLLLDNFEQVAAAADRVANLVASSPGLNVLVTSRSALNLRAEHELPVAPLPVPDPTPPVSVFALAANPAVELFLRRAQAVQPGFALTLADADAVATICQQLDGLPLALELAAARVRVLPPRAMLGHLGNRLGLLTGGPSDAATRQQTIRAAIGWSYDLLQPGEQLLFRQLAVLEGGGSLSAVEALGVRPPETALEIVGRLEQLERSSLVEVTETKEGEPRFRMLETIREYALERLAASGEEDQWRQRHTAYFQSFAAEAAGAFYSPAAGAWMSRLQLDQDNLRLVMRRHIERGDVDAGLRLGAALWWFWYVHGDASEGRALLADLLAAPGGEEDGVRAEALLGAAQLAQTQADYVVAEQLLQHSVALFRRVGDPRGTSAALLAAGFVARLQENYDSAVSLLEEARGLGQGIGHVFVTAASLHHLGMIAADHRRDYRAAHQHLNESLELYGVLALPRFVALLHLSLGDLAVAEGQLDLAGDLLHHSLATMIAAGEELGLHGALDSLAHLAALKHNFERAVCLAGAAQHLRDLHGTRSWPTTERNRTGWLADARIDLGDSAYETTWAEGLAMTREECLTQALDWDSRRRPAPLLLFDPTR